jgi:hypothetical protein
MVVLAYALAVAARHEPAPTAEAPGVEYHVRPYVEEWVKPSPSRRPRYQYAPMPSAISYDEWGDDEP